MTYTYSWVLTSGYTAGALSYSFTYADAAGITGIVLTGVLPFVYDKDVPSLSSLSFVSSGASGGVLVSFGFNESALTTFLYYLS